jgi:chemotaxis protein CheC
MAKILIVEDSTFQRKRIASALKEDGHEILEAVDGKKGLDILRKHSPDCILTDITMPEMDGVEFLAALKDQDNQIPVMVYTSDTQQKLRIECLELGASQFYNKPKLGDGFLQAVNETLKQKLSDEPTPYQIDALKEMANMGVGQAAGLLHEMLGYEIKLQVPSLRILRNIGDESSSDAILFKELSLVEVNFNGEISGTAMLAFPPNGASKLIKVLTGDEPPEIHLNSLVADTLMEVGNVVLNSVMGVISNMFEQNWRYSVPAYKLSTVNNLLKDFENIDKVTILLIQTNFIVNELEVNGDIYIVFGLGSLNRLLSLIP